MVKVKVKVSELSGSALDYAVAVAIGHKVEECFYGSYIRIHSAGHSLTFCPSSDWAHGGPIIERLRSESFHSFLIEGDGSSVHILSWPSPHVFHQGYGPTLLIAAMRCYVASKMGNEIELPEELIMRA